MKKQNEFNYKEKLIEILGRSLFKIAVCKDIPRLVKGFIISNNGEKVTVKKFKFFSLSFFISVLFLSFQPSFDDFN